MKFMKLGSKPDAFQTDGGGDSRYVLSELPSDIVIHVEEARFYLHKFPLLSKSSLLQRLIIEASQNGTDEVYIHDIPGGVKIFEICAKFCYGMVVTLNAYNVVAARCAAELLGMTEDVDKSNLVFKIEVFLNSGIFRSWKDSIIALQTTDALLPWSEQLKLAARCIDSIASKATSNPCNVVWSYTYNRKSASSDEIVEARKNSQPVPKDWWVEDLCELDVDLYKRVMVAVKSRGRITSDVVGEALKAYASRWLPECFDTAAIDDDAYSMAYNHLLETIVWLLPSDKGSSCCSCRFFLKLLKVAVLIGSGEMLKEELMDRVILQLHKASVCDLLIPARPPALTTYDIQLVLTLVGRFMRRAGVTEDGIFLNNLDQEMFETDVDDESLLALSKIVDGYLAEVASDPNLSVSSFVAVATSMPDAARATHDGLYTAIDVFLKLHPNLPKAEKRKISSLMDVKKLSKEACIHAAQNDRLPLRVVVQVLFFEQLRAAAGGNNPAAAAAAASGGIARLLVEEEDDDDDDVGGGGGGDWSKSRALPTPTPSLLKKQLGSLKLAAAGDEGGGGDDGRQLARVSSVANQSSRLSLSSRSRRMFDRLWAGGKPPGGEVVSKSSDTSGSSQSPRSSAKPPASKSSSSSSRNRRYSVS
ncbi:BTB/POZ domain-containing protein NPY1 [Oryza sativa Japonica Group]|uniref:Non-phototropic hypocotyl 3-like n=2 Tax=Oryza sativa subsp. japonica TaxID=39947 RepID=A3B921_ORYSJ|nr:BTB/POZ domain-containing protein NPY1 [Oryza sativa Japonica Group]EAZ36060.1 hypothetical protein OsJ_20369 [Oryza sativa Japonica Group]KAF2925522.1 hypothetical protein DAI22_06g059000 [Oryza sativa Japonica Group]USI00953.1 Bric-a-Brac, Tramtrack, Broad Complex BTB domain with non-phototropic hypocotyl 3 NPH3 domain BTBN14 [Oryza sativa Japonica Group]BAD72520.1 non-phototropic hypocotyl 3-like [Oryza sativa Japonica Group]BAF18908.1 Os06g0184500 [Oryza sativa Japonica Group]|eukprot:NP_001056994.1 Os06g0184500 [Oryza sativa Japonica Group]